MTKSRPLPVLFRLGCSVAFILDLGITPLAHLILAFAQIVTQGLRGALLAVQLHFV
jgi:hypothetical protein